MRNILYNLGYFLKETKNIVRHNLLSNIFSFFSTGLIFFILALVISGWQVSNRVVLAIQGEAEMSVYFNSELSDNEIARLTKEIEGIGGVFEARLINEEEAYIRMGEILGKEAQVLESFGDNPFSPFIEVKIRIEGMDLITKELNSVNGIEYVRDNREVLDRLRNISGALEILGFLILTAVGITTTVIIAHIIRTGIYDCREQIETLRLMGAPETFIAFPFLLEGLFITLAGGIMASVLIVFVLKYVYVQLAGPLPFIPLPPLEELTSGLIIFVMLSGAALGAAGSLFGTLSAKNK